MPPTRNFGLLTVKRQAIEGTAESDATGGYSMPIIAGMVGPTKEWANLPRMGNTMTMLGRYAQRAAVGGQVQLLAHPDAVGLLLYNVMGAELTLGTVTGGITPHTFVMADAWPGFLTVWSSLASGSDADVWRFRDACIARLAIIGESGANLVVEVEFVAKHYTKPAAGAAGWPANYNLATVLQGAAPRFKYIGSVVRLDPDSTPPAIMSNVESVQFEVARNPAVRYASSLTPAVYAPDRMVNFRASAHYSTGTGGTGLTAFDRHAWDFIEAAYLSGAGAYAGDPDQSTPAASFDVTFGVHPSSNGSSLRVVSGGGAALPTTVAVDNNWEYETSRPDAAGEPDLISYDLDGIVRKPSAGTTEATVILGSSRATLYST